MPSKYATAVELAKTAAAVAASARSKRPRAPVQHGSDYESGSDYDDYESSDHGGDGDEDSHAEFQQPRRRNWASAASSGLENGYKR